jgi:hypothetical protein
MNALRANPPFWVAVTTAGLAIILAAYVQGKRRARRAWLLEGGSS